GDELRPGDQGDGAAAHAVEERDQLRHRGHLGAQCGRDAQDHTGGQADDDDPPVVGVADLDQGGGHRERHTGAGDVVAAHGGLRAGQSHQPVDEHRERDDVEDCHEVVHQASPFFSTGLALNIPSIRSVTTKPPTTLSVPKISAMSRMICTPHGAPSSRVPSTTSAPSTTMPWMALVPDISGVCKVLGTLEMTVKP